MVGRQELHPLHLKNSRGKAVLPPLRAGEGRGGVALDLLEPKPPLPTSPCKQGEEQRAVSLLWLSRRDMQAEEQVRHRNPQG